MIEVVLYKGRQVELRFADGNSQLLDFQSNIREALQLLAAARLTWQKQKQQQEEDEEQLDFDISPLMMLEADNNQQPLPRLDLQPLMPGWHSSSRGRQAGLGGSLHTMFRSDERLGVPSTLHRISAMRNLSGEVIGLTYRIGRHVPGVALLLGDVLSAMCASMNSHR